MNIRKSFEAWFLREYGDGNFSRLESGEYAGEYADLAVRNYWGIWQGALATLEEQRSAVPEGWRLVPTAEKLKELLVVGAQIKIGKRYAEEYSGHAGEILTLVEGVFEEENGLYTTESICPAVWDADSKEFDSIYHLFENDLSGFLDCEVIGAAEDALLSAQPAEQRHFEWPKLDKPAKVGGVRFHKGVSSHLVIEAAQRHWEYDNVTPEEAAERADKLEELRELVLKPAEQHPDTFNGDNDALIRSARSLLSLDAKGALVPGGIGSDARCIITAFIARMERQQVIAEQAFSSMLEHGQAVSVGDPGRIRDAVDDMGKRNRAGTAQMAGMKVGGAVETEQQPAPDVSELVEALKWLRGAINCTPENDKHQSGAWISTSHPRIKRIDALIAACRKQGGEA